MVRSSQGFMRRIRARFIFGESGRSTPGTIRSSRARPKSSWLQRLAPTSSARLASWTTQTTLRTRRLIHSGFGRFETALRIADQLMLIARAGLADHCVERQEIGQALALPNNFRRLDVLQAPFA